jgi:hypothetical protein
MLGAVKKVKKKKVVAKPGAVAKPTLPASTGPAAPSSMKSIYIIGAVAVGAALIFAIWAGAKRK